MGFPTHLSQLASFPRSTSGAIEGEEHMDVHEEHVGSGQRGSGRSFSASPKSNAPLCVYRKKMRKDLGFPCIWGATICVQGCSSLPKLQHLECFCCCCWKAWRVVQHPHQLKVETEKSVFW